MTECVLLETEGAVAIHTSAPLADTEAFQKTVDVNLRGAFYLTAGDAKRMQATGGGAIVHAASIAVIVPGPRQGLYSVTKAATISMTKIFAAECAPWGVRVNALLPGITDTRFASALVNDEALRAQYLMRAPMNRVAQARWQAPCCTWLLPGRATPRVCVCPSTAAGW